LQKEIVPHYVGSSGQPIFPNTKNYARVELMKHKPWSTSHQLSSDDELINKFTTFLQDPKCSTSVKLSFERAKLKHQQMTRNFKEVISPDQEHSNPVSPDDRDTIELLATMNGLSNISDNFEVLENDGLDIGKNYDWSNRIFKVFFSKFLIVTFFSKLFIDMFFFLNLLLLLLLCICIYLTDSQ
jgi:hypothetical protein